MYLVIHTRLVRPRKNKKKPYVITDIKEQRGPCWTLQLDPENHKRMDFKSGQFAWITIHKTPFTLQQHPFTMCSLQQSREGILQIPGKI